MNIEKITSTNSINLLRKYLFELHDSHSKLDASYSELNSSYSDLDSSYSKLENTYHKEIKTKDQILNDKDKTIKIQSDKIKEQAEKLEALYDQMRLELKHRYGRHSERYEAPPEQMSLEFFDEAGNPLSSDIEKVEKADEEITVATHKRQKAKPGRKPLPEDLPRVEVIHDLPENEKTCNCRHPLHKIGADYSEQLNYIPAQLEVFKHVRYKYACRLCETVKMAPLPKHPIPKSIATSSLLTHIIISKYQDHLPLYRQEKIFKRLDIDIQQFPG